jgi:hypothetical protein
LQLDFGVVKRGEMCPPPKKVVLEVALGSPPTTLDGAPGMSAGFDAMADASWMACREETDVDEAPAKPVTPSEAPTDPAKSIAMTKARFIIYS